ncbi:LysR family transcriptional regulator [Kitasatospora sp. NBC_00240]|uniref:LysR family transcriptional regulator n=1 Tax=Kitasatospora sp. NBC_00240 TaxID=2903567 RepID=UPI00225AC189|nr:LysR family transcriptional regulator [Kitasatospora sp. NBC_00240]MCX5208475.1 LysR family transcriptional regulator [Kitasatospora sp. NBC_00240]
MLELRHLHVLRAIAREGSLAAAARALQHSQPTITHHLATLEAHFRTRLVERGPRGAVLTEAGETLLTHAEAVLARIGLAEREVRGLVEQGSVALRVGTFPTAGALLLPPAVRQVHGHGVRVSLTEGELPDLLAGLRSRELHLALVFSQPGDRLGLDEDFAVHPLMEDPLLLVLPADHPQAGVERVPLAALREEAWIVGTTDADPCDRLLGRACAREGFEPVHALRTDDYGVMQGFVAAGIGVALVPRLGLGRPREDIVVRELAGLVLARQIGVAMPRSGVSPAALDLLAALRRQARVLAGPD